MSKASYLKNAQSNPKTNRDSWYKNTAPAYAGIILWFVFWQNMVNSGGTGSLSHGLLVPICGVIVGALLCHFLFYLVPAQLGQKTGFPLAVIGSSVFGEKGGIIMPGLFMGLLQFGWVAVNIYWSSTLLSSTITCVPSWVIMIVWGIASTFIGLKGIKYVAPVATFLPIIPLAVLVLLLYKTLPSLGNFTPENVLAGGEATISSFGIFSFIITIMVGFFATAGAAGVDFGTCSRNSKDVQLGGLVGVSLAMIITGVAAILIMAGAYANPEIANLIKNANNPMIVTDDTVMAGILGSSIAKPAMFLLAVAAFPAACFSSLIAANSFKNMLPNVNANLSVAIGGAVAIILAITGLAADLESAFGFIGASFGPICGAIFVDYFISNRNWGGATKGFNIAGWLSWALGFTVGVLPNISKWVDCPALNIPMSPLWAFFVGAVVYFIASKLFKPAKL